MKIWKEAALVFSMIMLGGFGGWQLTLLSQHPPITLVQVYDDAWDEACEISRYICGNYPRPNVMYQPLANRMGTYYCARDVVLREGLDVISNDLAYATLIHEYVHFLQVVIHSVPCPFRSNDSRCLYEKEAFDLGAQVFFARGGDAEDIGDFYDIYQCAKPE